MSSKEEKLYEVSQKCNTVTISVHFLKLFTVKAECRTGRPGIRLETPAFANTEYYTRQFDVEGQRDMALINFHKGTMEFTVDVDKESYVEHIESIKARVKNFVEGVERGFYQAKADFVAGEEERRAIISERERRVDEIRRLLSEEA